MSYYPPPQPQVNVPIAQPVVLGYAGPQMGREQPPVSPGNPFLTIWTQPRATMRWLLYFEPTKYVLVLTLVNGLAAGLAGAFEPDGGRVVATSELPLAIVVSVLFGVIAAFIALYLMGWLTSWVGSWLGGRGNAQSLRAAFAWPLVMSIAASIVTLPILILVYTMLPSIPTGPTVLGGPVAIIQTPGLGTPQLLMILQGVIQLTLGIWGLVVYCKTIAEAHRFPSAWMGALVLLIVFAMLVAAFMAVMFGLLVVLR